MSTALDYTDFIETALYAAEDAASIIAAGSSIPGNTGRYSGPATFASTAAALQFVVARRAAIRVALSLLVFNATTPGGIATAMQWVLDAILAGASPADRLRILEPLAGIGGDGTVATCCRRVSLSRLAAAAQAYTPVSYEDAVTVRDDVCALIDAEIIRTADLGQDAMYQALRTLRIAIATALTTAAGQLPDERTVTVPALPAVVLAYRLYGDATRADGLVARVNPVDPLYMPTTLTVLSR